MKYFKFSESEFFLLLKIARRTKMDKWFSIRTRFDDDVIFDLEEEVIIDTKEALRNLMEGIEGYEIFDSLNLTTEEAKTLYILLNRLDLYIFPALKEVVYK